MANNQEPDRLEEKLFDELNKLGVDTGDGILRSMNNVGLYKRMLVAFAKMIRESRVTEEFDYEASDREIEKIHALKGVAGNLSVEPLYIAYSEIVRLLREGNVAGAKAVIRKVLPIQDKIVECIEKHS